MNRRFVNSQNLGGLAACALIAAALLLSGCASDPSPRGTMQGHSNESARSGLVLPGAPLVTMQRSAIDGERPTSGATGRGWENRRNDPPRDRAGIPQYAEFIYLEQRHIEHLRTTNTRPREHSSTTTRTIRRSLIVR